MENKGSLPCSQDPNAGAYPEPNESRPHPVSFRSILVLSSYLPLCMEIVLFSHIKNDLHYYGN
jgi:hypothetical protein